MEEQRKDADSCPGAGLRAVWLGDSVLPGWKTMRSYGPGIPLKACWLSQLFPRLRVPRPCFRDVVNIRLGVLLLHSGSENLKEQQLTPSSKGNAPLASGKL